MTDVTTLDTIFKTLEIVSLIGGGGVVIYRLGRTTQKFEGIAELQTKEISELKGEIKSIAQLVTQFAVQDTRLTNMSERMNRQDKIIDELRHGKGFIDVALGKAE